MQDVRNRQLAEVLVGFSTKVTPGDVVYISGVGAETEHLLECLAAAVLQAGGVPVVRMTEARLLRRLLLEADDAQLQQLGQLALADVKQAQCYIAVRAGDNAFELADVPASRMETYMRCMKDSLDYRVNETRWVILRFPNPPMAQLAQMSSEAFADFYYRVCCLDYAKMDAAMAPLQQRMQQTDRVHIVSPTTDLRFSIRDIPVIRCAGQFNIPDGECFTAPVRESVEGHVEFNTPTVHDGIAYDRIRLEFEHGKAVKAEAGARTDRLNAALDVDEGARYVGEFALGFNPHITEPMRDILFDEKIAGSFHMALGRAYDEAPNGNDSSLHWDMIQMQRPEQGGGEIYFDDELIRKDGRFVVDDLAGLNPEALV